jgi:translation elongation factor P/translation initiation factor 5A
MAAVLSPVAALAAKKNNNNNPKQKEKAPAYSKVTAVDASTGSITIADSDGKPTTFTTDNFTTITVNGERTTLAKVETGMKVTYTVGAGIGKITRLDAEDPPKPTKVAPKKKK